MDAVIAMEWSRPFFFRTDFPRFEEAAQQIVLIQAALGVPSPKIVRAGPCVIFRTPKPVSETHELSRVSAKGAT
ncbi:hypothetical protein [Psychromarinibacter sp. S121]|uniref:hypothetical protein n=1 Tax=Psychromarinibacter sp. S121 TaxID=3415127 RepID=UPI003C7E346C